VNARLRIVFAVLVSALGCCCVADEARAAPPGIPNRSVDIDLKSAAIENVLRLLGRIAQREVVLDPCVQGKIDLRLKNTPLPLVFDALAMKLGLVYDEDASGAIRVGCAAAPDAPTPGVRLSVKETGAELPDVLSRLAASAKLEGVDYRAAARPKINVTLESVRLSTAIAVLSDTSNVRIKLAGHRLVAD
jgi:hypothetical protein